MTISPLVTMVVTEIAIILTITNAVTYRKLRKLKAHSEIWQSVRDLLTKKLDTLSGKEEQTPASNVLQTLLIRSLLAPFSTDAPGSIATWSEVIAAIDTLNINESASEPSFPSELLLNEEELNFDFLEEDFWQNDTDAEETRRSGRQGADLDTEHTDDISESLSRAAQSMRETHEKLAKQLHDIPHASQEVVALRDILNDADNRNAELMAVTGKLLARNCQLEETIAYQARQSRTEMAMRSGTDKAYIFDKIELKSKLLELKAKHEAFRKGYKKLHTRYICLRKEYDSLYQLTLSLSGGSMKTDINPDTGLYFKDRFINRGNIILLSAEKQALSVAIIIIHCKDLNRIMRELDREAVAGVVTTLSERVMRTFRKGDLGTWITGDKIALMLPNVPADRIQNVADRYRKTVETASIAELPNLGKITVGAAYFPEHGQTLKELLEAARRQL